MSATINRFIAMAADLLLLVRSGSKTLICYSISTSNNDCISRAHKRLSSDLVNGLPTLFGSDCQRLEANKSSKSKKEHIVDV